MKQQTSYTRISENVGLKMDARRLELRKQRWDRNKSLALAEHEGLDLSDDRWKVIVYLRKHYLQYGLPRHARLLAREMNQHFSDKGGYHYLYQLFPDGPVSQGSPLDNLRIPADATDRSFGTKY